MKGTWTPCRIGQLLNLKKKQDQTNQRCQWVVVREHFLKDTNPVLGPEGQCSSCLLICHKLTQTL
jgi:hypothetical protein